MATETKNNGFLKPAVDDFYAIDVMNGNFDKVDEALAAKSDKTHNHDSHYAKKEDLGTKGDLETANKEDVVGAINEVKDLADTAKVTADQANSKANQAKTAADGAQSTADTATSKANTAQSTANTAKSKAETAQTTADRAEGKADSAQGTANVAKSKAEAAQTKADQAFQLGVEVKGDVVEALNSKKTIADSTTSNLWSALVAKIRAIKEGRGNASKSHVLSGRTFTNNDGVEYAGTMPNRGRVNANLTNQNQEYTIPAGYHNGTGKIKALISGLVANVIKAGTRVGGITGTFTCDANATAGDILSGKAAYVNGNRVNGQMGYRATGGYETDGVTKSGNELRMSIPYEGFYGDGTYLKYTDNEWVEKNIRAGVSMFGKVGTLVEGTSLHKKLITQFPTDNKVTINVQGKSRPLLVVIRIATTWQPDDKRSFLVYNGIRHDLSGSISLRNCICNADISGNNVVITVIDQAGYDTIRPFNIEYFITY